LSAGFVNQVVRLLGTKEERANTVEEYLSTRGQRKFFNVVVTSYEGVLKERVYLEKVRYPTKHLKAVAGRLNSHAGARFLHSLNNFTDPMALCHHRRGPSHQEREVVALKDGKSVFSPPPGMRQEEARKYLMAMIQSGAHVQEPVPPPHHRHATPGNTCDFFM
jgi:hypothetical protein